MPIYEIKQFRGGLSDYEDRGIEGSFKFGSDLDIRKRIDSLSANQALVDEGLLDPSRSPSSSRSPSASVSPSSSASATASPSASTSPSSSPSRSESPSSGISPSPSVSVSASASPSASVSPSHSLSPSPSPSSVQTTIFRDLIIKFVEGSDGYLYAFGNTGYVYRRDVDGVWVVVYKDADGGYKGAAEWYTDTGKTYLHMATDTTWKRKELPGRSDWNDVETVSTSLTSSDSHDMREAGGALIAANGPTLALYGYDQSFTTNALDLIPGNVARTIIERNGRTIVGTARKSDLTRGVNAAIDSEVPLAQVGEDGELFYSDMNSTMPVKSFPGGGKVNFGGVANEVAQVNFFEWEQDALSWIDKQSVGNMSLWAKWGGDAGTTGIYSYGRKNKNQPFVMNLEHLIDADELGALTVFNGLKIVSYRDGSDFGVLATDPSNKAEWTYQGLDFRAPIKVPGQVTTWDTAEVYCDPLVAGTTIEFWYRVNKSGDFVQAVMEDGSTQFSSVNEKKAVFLIAAAGEVFEPMVVGHPSGNTTPEVHRIRVGFN
jgi:hypothetical protein